MASQKYRRHFFDCVLLNLEALTPEVRSYDLCSLELSSRISDSSDFGTRPASD